MPEETQDAQDRPQDTPDSETAAENAERDAAEAPNVEIGDEQRAEEDDGPRNSVDVSDAGMLKKAVTVTIPRQRIDAKYDEMFGELSESAQVPGFRIGHAPRRLIEKRFGREVSRDVRNALIGESLGDALEQADLKTLGEPDIDLDAIELPDEGDMSFTFEVEVQPEFELPDTEGIRLERPVIEATDERIDRFVEDARMRFARHEETDEPARPGDELLAGVTINGEGVAPVERHGLTLRVAAGQIEGLPLLELGEALEGKRPGDTAELKIVVPEAHANEAWRGKELTVTIEVSQVRRRLLPELNDEFAQSAGFDTMEEMRDFVADRLRTRIAVEVQRSLRRQVCDYLLENTEFDLPEGVVARHTTRLLQRRYVDLLSQGVPREQIDEQLTRLQAEATEQARDDLKLSFILGKAADEAGVEAEEAELNARIAQMASAYDRRPERLRQELSQDGSLESVVQNVREDKVLDAMIEKAEVVDVEPDQGDAEENQPETT